jgi:PKD repeat protein
MSSLAVALILCTTLFLSAPTASADFVGDWSARFGGMGIYSRGIKVDGNGNVYVLGQIRSGAGGKIVTIKYSPSGSMLWERQVDGTGGAFDIEVDGTGNAYITGGTPENDSYHDLFSDITTVKYDTNGNELWVAVYNAPAHTDPWYLNWSYGDKITVDGAGNVYVLGRITYFYTNPDEMLPNMWDWVIIKYDSQGNEMWASLCKEEANSTEVDIRPRDMAVDGNGNVFVTGTIYVEPIPGEITTDYATIKYDSNGNRLWMATYDNGSEDGAGHLVLDSSDNIYVVGDSESVGQYEVTTIKYNTDGNELRVTRHNSPNAWWGMRLNGGMGIDAQDNIYLVGKSNGYVTVIKYDVTGNEVWTVQYDEFPDSSLSGNVNNCVVESNGNIHIAGSNTYLVGERKTFIMKLNPNGDKIWHQAVDNNTTEASFVATNNNGKVYLLAQAVEKEFERDGTSEEYLVTIQFNPDSTLNQSVDFFSSNTELYGTPFTVTFSDQSIGSFDSWQWDFNEDGIVDSVVQNPSYTYTDEGVYSVSLQVSGPDGQVNLVKENYITVESIWINKIRNKRCSRGELIRIIGSGFGVTQGDSVIHIGNKTYDSTSPRIKLWSHTKIKFKVRRPLSWFERKAGSRIKVWVTVNGVDSNKKRIIPQFP